MTVEQLREALAQMPAHVEVIVEIPHPAEVGTEPDYFRTLECTPNHEMPRGNFACIHLDMRS